MRIIGFICVLLAISISVKDVYSQNLRIEGVGQNIGGKTIRISSTLDNLSNLERELSQIKLSETDSLFNFSLTIPNSCLIKISIETFDYVFLAQKGGTYNLRILPFDFSISDTINTLFYKIPLPISIESSNNKGINSKIYTIDSILEDYLVRYDREILFFKDKAIIKQMQEDVNSVIDSNDTQYIKDYLYYRLAQLEYSAKIVNPNKLKADIFYNKPILYDNIAYMECFETIYGNYFTDGNTSFSVRTLERWLEGNNYFALIDSLGLDTLLKNEVFRELVFLRGMKEAFFSNKFEKLFIVTMLENFVYQTKFTTHKDIAHNLLELFAQKSSYGFKSKEFVLQDIYGNHITLDKYKGKPLIISFVKLHEPACLRELQAMYKFVDTLSESYNFLTITCDRSLDALYNFLVNSKVGVKYKWDFAHFDKKWDLLKDYDVKVFPKFILIDGKGTILQNPMRKPSEGSLIPFIPRKTPDKRDSFFAPK